MENCIFCKIIKGEIPCSKVYEDSETIAFLDIGPVNKGHTLVVPKKHSTDITDTPDETLFHLIKIAKKIAIALEKAVGAEGINIGISNKKAAGQEVFHIHIHVIPRYSTDCFKHWPQGKYNEGEAEQIKNMIIERLK